MMVKAMVTTTGTVNGKRVYNTHAATFDPTRVEWDFSPEREGCPAQHRIFTERVTVWQGERHVGYVPELIVGATPVALKSGGKH